MSNRKEYSHQYYLKNKESILKRQKERFDKTPEIFHQRCLNTYYNNKMYYIKKGKEYLLKNPWVKHFKAINDRCNSIKNKAYKYYGGKGIKNKLTLSDIKEIWFRDKAYLLKYPSIDRKDANQNYTLQNSRFIEFCDNCSNKPNIIYQYNLNGQFIKQWFNAREIKRKLKIDDSYIRKVIRDNTQYAYGYYWIEIK